MADEEDSSSSYKPSNHNTQKGSTSNTVMRKMTSSKNILLKDEAKYKKRTLDVRKSYNALQNNTRRNVVPTSSNEHITKKQDDAVPGIETLGSRPQRTAPSTSSENIILETFHAGRLNATKIVKGKNLGVKSDFNEVSNTTTKQNLENESKAGVFQEYSLNEVPNSVDMPDIVIGTPVKKFVKANTMAKVRVKQAHRLFKKERTMTAKLKKNKKDKYAQQVTVETNPPGDVLTKQNARRQSEGISQEETLDHYIKGQTNMEHQSSWRQSDSPRGFPVVNSDSAKSSAETRLLIKQTLSEAGLGTHVTTQTGNASKAELKKKQLKSNINKKQKKQEVENVKYGKVKRNNYTVMKDKNKEATDKMKNNENETFNISNEILDKGQRKSSAAESKVLEHTVPKIVVDDVAKDAVLETVINVDIDTEEEDNHIITDRKLSKDSLGSNLSDTSRRKSLLSDLDLEEDPEFEAHMLEVMNERKQRGKKGRRRHRGSASGSSTSASRRPSIIQGQV